VRWGCCALFVHDFSSGQGLFCPFCAFIPTLFTASGIIAPQCIQIILIKGIGIQ
jgi:hypothetical protein